MIVEVLAKNEKQKGKNSSHRLLPILLDITGEEVFVRMLRSFAGRVLSFPSISTIIEAYLILFVWEEMKNIKLHDGKSKNKRLGELSKKYNCDASLLYNIAKKIFKGHK